MSGFGYGSGSGSGSSSGSGSGIGPNGIVDGTTNDDVILPLFIDVDGDQVDGADGDDDVIFAYEGDDYVDAGAGNDTVEGGQGADTLSGGEGTNILRGGDEDDVFIGGDGADKFDGGRDEDVIDYSGSGEAVNVDLSTSSLSGGDADNDTIIGGIDGVIGSDFDDTLTGFDHQGTSDPDVYSNFFDGGAGDDTIDGRGGDDELIGGRQRFDPWRGWQRHDRLLGQHPASR